MIFFTLSLIGCVAWMGHTDASREAAEDAIGALVDCTGSHKAAAEAMKLGNEQQLSRQVAGTEPLNLHRLSLVPGFWPAFMKRRAKRLGGMFFDAQETACVVGFFGMGKRKFLRFLPFFGNPDHSNERRVF